jgi:hypothetical protein
MVFLSKLSIGMLLLVSGICTLELQSRPVNQYIYRGAVDSKRSAEHVPGLSALSDHIHYCNERSSVH